MLGGLASLGAGLVHLAVVQQHLEEWWLYGIFFAVSVRLQIGWAVAALAMDRAPLLRTWPTATCAVVTLWAVTPHRRASPRPGALGGGGRRPGRVPDSLLEVAVAGALLVAARCAARRAPAAGRSVGRFVALMFAGALAVSAVTTPGARRQPRRWAARTTTSRATDAEAPVRP